MSVSALCAGRRSLRRKHTKTTARFPPRRARSSQSQAARPPSPLFSQVLILKVVKVLCFDTLLQVLILRDLRVHQKCASSDRFSGSRCRKRQHGCRTPRNAKAKPGSPTCVVTRNKNAAGSEGVAAGFQDAVFYE